MPVRRRQPAAGARAVERRARRPATPAAPPASENPVDDAGVVRDVDTPEDLSRAARPVTDRPAPWRSAPRTCTWAIPHPCRISEPRRLPALPSFRAIAPMRPIHYTIRPVRPARPPVRGHRYASPTGPRKASACRLPVWIPGSYMIREFARHLEGVAAEVGGSPVRFVKETKSTLDLRRLLPDVGAAAGGLVPRLCLGPFGARRAPRCEPRLFQRHQRLPRGRRTRTRAVQRRHPAPRRRRRSRAGGSRPPCRRAGGPGPPSDRRSDGTARATTTS